jgi:hypothetical protein
MNYNNTKLQNAVDDLRYTVDLEFTGKSKSTLFVVRFCGDFVASSETLNGAILSAIFHKDERSTKLI